MAQPKYLSEFLEFELQRDPEYVKKAQERKDEAVNSFGSFFDRGVASTKKALYDGLQATGTAIEQKTGKVSTGCR